MTDTRFTGVILNSGIGSEASLIIPLGDYRIMIISDDSCGAGKGEVRRAELYVYHMSADPSDNINSQIFGTDFVIANTDSLLQAIDYLRDKEA